MHVIHTFHKLQLCVYSSMYTFHCNSVYKFSVYSVWPFDQVQCAYFILVQCTSWIYTFHRDQYTYCTVIQCTMYIIHFIKFIRMYKSNLLSKFRSIYFKYYSKAKMFQRVTFTAYMLQAAFEPSISSSIWILKIRILPSDPVLLAGESKDRVSK